MDRIKPKKIKPEAGIESVWDYPRPPKLEKFSGHIKILFNNEIIADTNSSYRVLETSHPPVYYIPQCDIKMHYLRISSGASYCEWKGDAYYYDLDCGQKTVQRAGWFYSNPKRPFREIKNHIAFYAYKMDGCFVNDEQVTSQPGGFYGGWITKNIAGPFKGEPGTWGW
ncbi:MAG: DUF427 domain-containing protein [Melioribacteraceae bacterium]|nr:DUF427 domain-containing protein [Melioribacteraceae bacterium]MCF8264140.1 DUF427 domain-containing protein [Melioribacteraceae bacterium]MCF8430764.1 DUF427 domain-containing protein [Melioribacteraceae bacterium]